MSKKHVAAMLRRLLSMVLSLALSGGVAGGVMAYAAEPELDTPSAILMEASTGTVIYEKNADESLHPASVTKVMTLILIFDALKDGRIRLEDSVTVSERAASMGGSQVYLEAGEKQTVNTLIKCISVASANDASVAMAEYIWGSEEVFVEKMNERARGLGMDNTRFVNCCGLDDDAHVMSARDVALMSRELINEYPEIHEYSTIWMDEITHVTRKGESQFGLTNTNKLIKQYEWATGLKTGSTSKAGCCLSATALKGEVELIAVVMAAPDSKTRFADAQSLLNYGFGMVDIYTDETPLEDTVVKVGGCLEGEVGVSLADTFSHVFTEMVDKGRIARSVEYMDGITAPISSGDVLGQVVYTLGESDVLGTVDIIADSDVLPSGWWDYAKCLMGKMWLA